MRTLKLSFLGAGLMALCTLAAMAGTSVSGPEALNLLKAGSERFAAGTATHPNQTQNRRADLSKGQQPIAAILSCADSRVSPEIVFDQGLGDIFDVRVAGNLAGPDELGSLEYAVEHLGVPLVLVVGHEKCGAVTAALDHADVHGAIKELVHGIEPAADRARGNDNGTASHDALLSSAVRYNVQKSIEDLIHSSAVIRERVASGKLKIEGAVYDISTGRTAFLGEHPEQARLVTEANSAPAAIAQPGGPAANESSGAAQAAANSSAPAHNALNYSDVPIAPAAKALNPHPAIWPWVVGTPIVMIVLLAGLWAFARTGLEGWTISQRLAGNCVLVLTLLAAVGAASIYGMHTAAKALDIYQDDSRSATMLGRIQANFLEMRVAAKDYQLAPNKEAVARYEERFNNTSKFIEEVSKMVEEQDRQDLVKGWPALVGEHRRFFSELQRVKGRDMLEIERQMGAVGSKLIHQIEALKLAYVKDLDITGPAAAANDKAVQVMIWCIGSAAILMGLFLAYILSRSLVTPLRRITLGLSASSDETAAAAREVSSSSQALAEGASEQAASLEETSASLEQMAAMTKRNDENTQSAKELVLQTSSAADSGVQSTREMTKSMQRISTASTELREAMQRIRTSGSDVSKIIKTIDEIAFQTNILALNAAVEAARAGEAGMGFAVVADEVRNLAQRSATAARETASLIESSIRQSEEGVQVSERVGQAILELSEKSHEVEHKLQEIGTRVREMDEKTQQIAVASQEQTQGISQVNIAVSQMDKVTQNNAASAEETASASEELNAQAEALKTVVEELQKMVGGGNRAEAVQSPLRLTRPIESPARPSNGRKLAPATSRPASSYANGSANGRSNRREIPMPAPRGVDLVQDSDFRDF